MPGQALELGSGAGLRMLAAGERGAVLLLEWGSFQSLLLAGGGLASLNPPEWIGKLRPQAVLLSVATGNRYGLPNPETLQAVQGYTLLRTDRNGWIEINADGERMWVEVERR